jgi:cullin 4
MAKALVKFTEYYISKHKGHKLEWSHSLGHAVLTGRFGTGPPKDLSVSLYQAVVLLLFNEQTTLTFEDIKAGAGLGPRFFFGYCDICLIAYRHLMYTEDGELRRTLQSLACGPKKILKKQPVGRDVNDGDVFVFNDGFTDPRRNVHINSIQAKETVSVINFPFFLVSSNVFKMRFPT